MKEEKHEQAPLKNTTKQAEQRQEKQTEAEQEAAAIQAFIGHVEKNDKDPQDC